MASADTSLGESEKLTRRFRGHEDRNCSSGKSKGETGTALSLCVSHGGGVHVITADGFRSGTNFIENVETPRKAQGCIHTPRPRGTPPLVRAQYYISVLSAEISSLPTTRSNFLIGFDHLFLLDGYLVFLIRDLSSLDSLRLATTLRLSRNCRLRLRSCLLGRTALVDTASGASISHDLLLDLAPAGPDRLAVLETAVGGDGVGVVLGCC